VLTTSDSEIAALQSFLGRSVNISDFGSSGMPSVQPLVPALVPVSTSQTVLRIQSK